jgi:hypothetical protein
MREDFCRAIAMAVGKGYRPERVASAAATYFSKGNSQSKE